MSDLERLAERVEALTGPCRETDALIWCALRGVKYKGHNPPYGEPQLTQVEFTEPPKRSRQVSNGRHLPHALPYTASLDAATTLVPEGYYLSGASEGLVGGWRMAKWIVILAPRQFPAKAAGWSFQQMKDLVVTGSAETWHLALTAAALRAIDLAHKDTEAPSHD